MLEYFQFTKSLANYRLLNNILNFASEYLLKLVRLFFSRKNNDGGVVIITLHKIGDTVFTFPAIKALFNFYKDKKITLICYPAGKEIYEYFFNCKTVVLKKEMFYLGDRIANSTARRIIKNMNPEIIIDLTACMKSATLIVDSPAAEISGSNRELFKGIYKHYSPVRKIPPLTDLYLDAIKTFIPQYDIYRKNLFIKPEEVSGKILIHPFAGWKAKEWGMKKFITLAKELSVKYNTEFVVESGSMNKEIFNEVLSSGIEIRETFNLTDLLNSIEECAMMISNDTGCIYLAAALGKATFTIYGPTNPSYSNPGNKYHSYIQKIIECSPKKEEFCFTFGGQKGCPSFQCMIQLSENEVLSRVNKFLNEIGFQPRG